MTYEDIRTQVLAVFRELEITTEEVPDDANLADDYDVDSTEMVEIVVHLELALSTKLSPGTEKVATFGELLDSVAAQLSVEA